MHAQGQAALDAFAQDALETALRHLGQMEDANLEVMRIVTAVVDQYETGQVAQPDASGTRALHV